MYPEQGKRFSNNEKENGKKWQFGTQLPDRDMFQGTDWAIQDTDIQVQ